jgi:hypothetical protein
VRAKDGRELFLLGCAAEAKYDAGLKDRLAIAGSSCTRDTARLTCCRNNRGERFGRLVIADDCWCESTSHLMVDVASGWILRGSLGFSELVPNPLG